MKENQDSLAPQGGGDESREPESSAVQRKDPEEGSSKPAARSGRSKSASEAEKTRETAIGRCKPRPVSQDTRLTACSPMSVCSCPCTDVPNPEHGCGHPGLTQVPVPIPTHSPHSVSFLKMIDFFLYVQVFFLHVCLCATCTTGTRGGQKVAWEPVEMELQMVMSLQVGARN